MKKLLYLHGLSSGGQSTTARLLQKLLPDFEVLAPDIPLDPYEALAMLSSLAMERLDESAVIVGTSMGAFYAQMMRGWQRLLINPSFYTSRVILRPNIGNTLQYFLPRRDGIQHFAVTEELCRAVEDVESRQFDVDFGVLSPWTDSTDKVKAFFGVKDTTVNCQEEYLQHYTRCDYFNGAHRLDPATTAHIIIPEIKKNILKNE